VVSRGPLPKNVRTTPVKVGGLHSFPLLQFHDHSRRCAVGVAAGKQQIDPLGSVVDFVLDGYAQLARDLLELQHVAHALE
jgi:hypothetical protein